MWYGDEIGSQGKGTLVHRAKMVQGGMYPSFLCFTHSIFILYYTFIYYLYVFYIILL